MTLKRMTPALLAATIALSGVAGLLVGSVSPSHAITSVDELSDVNRNHWAFEALRDLVEKYDVIEGYPDLTFRGNRQPTRWEMAAALNALVKTIGRDLARLGAEKADKRDLQTVARLQEEFRNELNALNARTKALEDRASAIEAKNDEQDARLSLLEKTQIHGDLSLGFMQDFAGEQNVDGITGIGRLRLALDIPVKEETADSKIGRGDVYARLIAAWGRNTASGGQNFSGYSRIAGDADKNNDGINTTMIQDNSNGTSTRPNVYLETAYYKQNFKSGIPVLTDLGITPDEEGWETTGDLYFGLIPWRFLFDKSPYRGNELDQFQNTLLVNTPGLAVNQNSPMIAYQWHQGLGEKANFDFTTAAASINGADIYDGFNVTYEGRLNYISGNDWFNNGSVYVGGYHVWFGGGTIGQTTAIADRFGNSIGGLEGTRTDAFYGGWNQEWYKGIGTFVNAVFQGSSPGAAFLTAGNQVNGANNLFNTGGNITSVRYAASAGVQVPMSAFGDWRADDTFGLGYAVANLHRRSNAESGSATDFEHVVEGYYKYQFTDSISVVPSVQFIMNRYGLDQNNFSTAFGVRTNFLF